MVLSVLFRVNNNIFLFNFSFIILIMRKICFSIMAFNIRYSLLDKNIFRFYLNFFIKIFYKPNHIAGGSIIIGSILSIVMNDHINSDGDTPGDSILVDEENHFFLRNILENTLSHQFILPISYGNYDEINILNLS